MKRRLSSTELDETLENKESDPLAVSDIPNPAEPSNTQSEITSSLEPVTPPSRFPALSGLVSPYVQNNVIDPTDVEILDQLKSEYERDEENKNAAAASRLSDSLYKGLSRIGGIEATGNENLAKRLEGRTSDALNKYNSLINARNTLQSSIANRNKLTQDVKDDEIDTDYAKAYRNAFRKTVPTLASSIKNLEELSVREMKELQNLGIEKERLDIQKADKTKQGLEEDLVSKEYNKVLAKDLAEFQAGITTVNNTVNTLEDGGVTILRLKREGKIPSGSEKIFLESLYKKDPDGNTFLNILRARGLNKYSEYYAFRRGIESTVNYSLKPILGSQFTKEEGQRIIDQAFDPTISEEQSAKRLKNLALESRSRIETKRKLLAFAERQRKAGKPLNFLDMGVDQGLFNLTPDLDNPRTQYLTKDIPEESPAASTPKSKPSVGSVISSGGKRYKVINENGDLEEVK